MREETGVNAELIERLGDVRLHATSARAAPVAKRVRFFLFDTAPATLADHDHEIEEARWMPLQRGRRARSPIAGEREMVRRALSRSAPDR